MKGERLEMMDDQKRYSLDGYIRETEPESEKRSSAWKTAIGLQDVDGLRPSSYLRETAREHIEGRIDISTAKLRIDSYYKAQDERTPDASEIKEADIVSVRIAEILNQRSFSMSPEELIRIHGRLFSGIYDHAGAFRDCNVTKKEWVLDGDTVLYTPHEIIAASLDYDFREERNFSYDISLREASRHIASFISGVWQIHPFAEGNTRTTAVFLIKYLQAFGFNVSDEPFESNSWYFRNALVRANYQNLQKGIRRTTDYLELFFDNLLFGAEHELKNRYLHVDWKSAEKLSLGEKLPGNLTLEESAVLGIIKDDPSATQAEIAERTGKSISTVKNLTISLSRKGVIVRIGGKRYGSWKVSGRDE